MVVHHITLCLWLNLEVLRAPFASNITRMKIYLCFCLFINSIQLLPAGSGSVCFLAWLWGK